MNSIKWLAIVLILISCKQQGREPEKILTDIYIETLTNLLRYHKHNTDYERSNRIVAPIINGFVEELKSKSDHSRTIYSIDTLLESRVYENEYLDSLYIVLSGGHFNVQERQSAMATFLSQVQYMESYHSFYCGRNVISTIISADTIYYPRHKVLKFHKVILRPVLDTIQEVEVVSFEHYKNGSEISVSTETELDYLTEEISIEIINPVTKEKKNYKKNLVIRVVDLLE